MASIELRGLRRHHPGAASPALVGLDLVVNDGELLVVVGPSGCGKSTALRLIAGLDAPDAGTVRIGDRDVTRVPPQERDVAMVFQGYALYPHLTARENIAFPLAMRGVPRAERETRVREAAALLSIERLLDRRPSELSGGERQRVAMGRAIVRSPKAFLFDEPLSNLDAALRGELRVELAALVRRLRTTSMYVTHDQIEAMTMADRIAVMRAGELQQVGPPREVYERPANAFVAAFLGSPPINLIEVEVTGGRGRAPGIDLPVSPGLEASGKVVAGIRPEHLTLRRGGLADPAGPAAYRDLASDVGVVEAVVTATEPLGRETYVHLDAKGTALRATAPGFEAPGRGAALTLTVDPARILWFDAPTGRALARGAAPAGSART